ncbi:MAG: glycosyltransferase family 2 protein [Clostridium sp.]|uniref:glycosyltransferase family 2 protein n=1 Tax=Clostridium sp. TaxID=1506 RepID=UPI003EE7D4B3
MELISIIMPTYKRKELFNRALKSLINQTYSNIEIVIIDDNSEFPDYRNYVESVINEYNFDKRIKYIQNKKNIGGALSRNVGIQNSKGRYITFLDDDDEYVLSKIELQYNFYKNRFKNDEGVIYSQSITLDKNKKKISRTKTYVEGNRDALFYMMSGNLATTGNLFLPKVLLEKVEGFKKLDCGQEWYVIFNILLKGYNCAYMKDELLRYYEHDAERITTNYLKKYNGEKKLYEIKKEHMSIFNEQEQKKLNYKINIMLANYAIKVSKKEVINHLKKAKESESLKLKDLGQLGLKMLLSEEQYNYIKKILN